MIITGGVKELSFTRSRNKN